MYAPDAVSGDIISAGSSTVFPLSERMAQRFSEEGFTGNITIDSIGTGGGFRTLLRQRRDRHRQCQPRHQRQRTCLLPGHRP